MSMPCAFMSSIILSIHAFVGLHLSLLPSTWLSSAIIGSLPFSILVTCPNHVSPLFLIVSIIVSFCSIFSRIISLRILSRLDFPSIPFSQLIFATSSLLPSSLLRHQHSEPYSRTGSLYPVFCIISFLFLSIFYFISTFSSVLQTSLRPDSSPNILCALCIFRYQAS